MIANMCGDILKRLEERIKDCSLEEEQRFVRKAHDEMERKIFQLPLNIGSYNLRAYSNIYEIFMPLVEKRRKLGRSSDHGTSLVTCPEKRPRRFYYPGHELVLHDLIWEIFHNQKRGEDSEPDTTVLLVCAESIHGNKKCIVKCNDDRGHAEINALRSLANFAPKKIDMHISRSPCFRICLPAIQEFIERSCYIKSFRIRFSSVHAHYEPEEMYRLWKLKQDNPGIVGINVFDEEDWDHLEKHLTADAYRMLRRQFREMRKNLTAGTSSEADEDNFENENSGFSESTSDYSDGGGEFYDTNDGNTYNYNKSSGDSEDEDEDEVLSDDDMFPRINSKRKYQNDDNIGLIKRKKIQPLKYYDDDDDDDDTGVN